MRVSKIYDSRIIFFLLLLTILSLQLYHITNLTDTYFTKKYYFLNRFKVKYLCKINSFFSTICDLLKSCTIARVKVYIRYFIIGTFFGLFHNKINRCRCLSAMPIHDIVVTNKILSYNISIRLLKISGNCLLLRVDIK